MKGSAAEGGHLLLGLDALGRRQRLDINQPPTPNWCRLPANDDIMEGGLFGGGPCFLWAWCGTRVRLTNQPRQKDRDTNGHYLHSEVLVPLLQACWWWFLCHRGGGGSWAYASCYMEWMMVGRGGVGVG